MMRRLSRDYWPEEVRNPELRSVLAVVIGPLVPIVLIGGGLWTAFWMLSEPGATDWRLGRELLKAALFATYAIMLTVGVVVLALIWSMRLTDWWVFALSGGLIGFFSALLYGVLLKQSTGAAPLMIVSLVGAINFLSIRWIAGIRKR